MIVGDILLSFKCLMNFFADFSVIVGFFFTGSSGSSKFCKYVNRIKVNLYLNLDG